MRHFVSFGEMPRSVLAGIYQTQAALLRAGLTNILHFEGDEQTLVASVEGSVVGILMWRETEPGEWWTQLGYVDNDHRGKGIYKFMWDQLIGLAAVDGAVKNIVGCTAYENLVMRSVMEKLGRVPTFIQYDYRLDGTETVKAA